MTQIGKGQQVHRRRPWNLCIGTSFLLLAASTTLLAQASEFSEWNQSSGFKRVEYRWRQADGKACVVEYRNLDDRDHRRYKSRIVFQADGDERINPYTVVSFAQPTAGHTDTVPVCTMITDVSVTRF